MIYINVLNIDGLRVRNFVKFERNCKKMIEYKDLQPKQRNVILVVLISLPFVYISLYFINRDFVLNTPFYISTILALCLTLLVSAFNSINAVYLSSRLGCFEGELVILWIIYLLNIGWISLFSITFYTVFSSFYWYVCCLIVVPFTPACVLFFYSVYILMRDSRGKN